MAELFRDVALRLLTEAFGEPAVIKTAEGPVYRWKLERPGRPHMALYVTLDSPEMPDLAHIMISDPNPEAPEPLTSVVMRTAPEVKAGIALVRARHKG